MITMTYEKACEIAQAKDLSMYTHDELSACDLFIKCYALDKFEQLLCILMPGNGSIKELREYVLLMAKCHYGSVETDILLSYLYCYPDWCGHD